jgi:hypothetical protein
MNNRVIEKNDCVIILDESFAKVPYDCPVCECALRHFDDVVSFKSFDCCVDCQNEFYWPNLAKWKKGWRPKKEDVRKFLNNYNCLKGENQNAK